MNDIERSEEIKQKTELLQQEGYVCGPASLKILAEAYKIPFCHELECQSKMFTHGGGVGNRCAVFQAATVIIGVWYGRSNPQESREPYRNAMRILSDTFQKEYGGYMCRYFTDCEEVNEASFVHLMETAAKALDNIRETITK